MTERITCWSCGQEEPKCPCEGGFVPLIVNPPKEVLPVCGGTIYVNEPWADRKRYQEKMLRPCCSCEEMWVCNYTEWTNGKCPHCHTSGVNG